MLRIFTVQQQKLERLELQSAEQVQQAIWLDLQEPDEAERSLISDQFGQQ